MNRRTLLAAPLALLATAARAEDVDAYLGAQMEALHVPSLALAVVKDGKIEKAAAYGTANLEHGVPATTKTVYQIQSITKTFTATAIMMLVEEGKLALEDPVGKHLEGTPDLWKPVTLRHLLSHTSGIKDFINEPTASLRLEVTEEQVLRDTAARPLNFPTGDKYAYSNTNYHLLGMVIRKHTGMAFGDFLQKRIFDPLEMSDTRIISHAEIIPNRAAGYRWNGKELENGAFIAPSVLGYAGGGIRSTVLDLAKWDAALYTERLVKQATLERMWTRSKLNDGSESNYGLGWVNGRLQGHRFVDHTGAHSTGFNTCLMRFLDDHLTVIVLANLTPLSAERLALGVASRYLPGAKPT